MLGMRFELTSVMGTRDAAAQTKALGTAWGTVHVRGAQARDPTRDAMFLPVNQSVYLFITYLSISIIDLSVVYQSVHASICPCIHLCICPSIYLSSVYSLFLPLFSHSLSPIYPHICHNDSPVYLSCPRVHLSMALVLNDI
jgi:hypothetical protein